MGCYSYYLYFSLRLNSSLVTLPQTFPNITPSNYHVLCCVTHASIPALNTECLPCYLIVWPPLFLDKNSISMSFFWVPRSGLVPTFLEQREALSPGGQMLCSYSFPDRSAPLASPGSNLKGCTKLSCKLKADQGAGPAMATFMEGWIGETSPEQSIHLKSCLSSCT